MFKLLRTGVPSCVISMNLSEMNITAIAMITRNKIATQNLILCRFSFRFFIVLVLMVYLDFRPFLYIWQPPRHFLPGVQHLTEINPYLPRVFILSFLNLPGVQHLADYSLTYLFFNGRIYIRTICLT